MGVLNDKTRQLLQQGVAHLQSGLLREAEACCRAVVQRSPKNADAWHLLGLTAKQAGDLHAAADMIAKAVGLDGRNPVYRNNLGLVAMAQGRRDEALALFRAATAIEPGYAAAHANLGLLLQELGQLEEAAEAYRSALHHAPAMAAAINNLAMVLRRQEKLDEAMHRYRQVLALHPNLAEAYFNIANVLHEQEQLHDAARNHRRSLLLQPRHVDARGNLGNVYRDMRQWDEAEACYRQALAEDARSTPLLRNLGQLLYLQGRIDEAYDCFTRCVDLTPTDIDALTQLGDCRLVLMRVNEALDCYRRAVALQPDDPRQPNQLATALQMAHRTDDALAWFERVLRLKPDDAGAQCNFGHTKFINGDTKGAIACFRSAIAIDPDAASAHHNLLLTTAHYDRCTPEEHFAQAMEFGRQVTDALLPGASPHTNDPDPDRPLRVGFVSADLRQHAVAHFLEPVLEALNRARFQTFAYANSLAEDRMSQRLKRLVDHWIVVAHLEDETLAARIRADGIDVLIDLSGHTAGNRLTALALKPAPVQATWLGYPGSTGMAAMDWRLTDAWCDPPGLTEHLHCERLWRLPTVWNVYRPAADSTLMIDHPPADDNGFVTFGSFNKMAKLSDDTVALWASILSGAPETRLMLKDAGLSRDEPRERVLQRFAAHGVAPDRLILIDRAPGLQYAAYNNLDVALDPFPYNGTTTSMDALWMGVPFVTLAGRACVSRTGTSLLINAGLEELVAETPADYRRIALRLADDRAYLRKMRQGLRARIARSPLMDAERFAHDFEAALLGMWRDWCDRRLSVT